jgi:hypothetical protein
MVFLICCKWTCMEATDVLLEIFDLFTQKWTGMNDPFSYIEICYRLVRNGLQCTLIHYQASA